MYRGIIRNWSAVENMSSSSSYLCNKCHCHLLFQLNNSSLTRTLPLLLSAKSLFFVLPKNSLKQKEWKKKKQQLCSWRKRESHCHSQWKKRSFNCGLIQMRHLTMRSQSIKTITQEIEQRRVRCEVRGWEDNPGIIRNSTMLRVEHSSESVGAAFNYFAVFSQIFTSTSSEF